MRYLLIAIFILSTATLTFGKLNVVHEWKYVDLIWESPQQKQKAIDSGEYNASMMYLFDVDVAPDDRIFVTAIKEKGSPVSVMTVTDQKGPGGLLLRPYPDWSWYKNNDCNGIAGTVYRVDIHCNHLFLVDSGKILLDNLEAVVVCPARLFIFDLSNDKLVERITIPSNIADNKNGTGFLTAVAVFAPNCKTVKHDAVVFMSDTDGFGMVVYNASALKKFCRIQSDTMKSTGPGYTVGNQFYPLEDGILGSTVVRNKELYYVSFTGNKIHKMDISRTIECPASEADALAQRVATLPDSTTVIASVDCAIFFVDIEKTAVMCADTTKEINSHNMGLVGKDFETLQMPCGLKNREGKLIVLSNKWQYHDIYIGLNISETNFYILSADNMEIQKETNCFASCPGTFIS